MGDTAVGEHDDAARGEAVLDRIPPRVRLRPAVVVIDVDPAFGQEDGAEQRRNRGFEGIESLRPVTLVQNDELRQLREHDDGQDSRDDRRSRRSSSSGQVSVAAR